MSGYVIRCDTPDCDRVYGGRVVHLSPGTVYLEHLPYHGEFVWMAHSLDHAAVFDEETATIVAALVDPIDADGLVTVTPDDGGREPRFTPETVCLEHGKPRPPSEYGRRCYAGCNDCEPSAVSFERELAKRSL